MGRAIIFAMVAAVSATTPKILPIEHASVLLTYSINGQDFHVYSDPVDQRAEGLVGSPEVRVTFPINANALSRPQFDKLPPADLIMITHSHSDHFQPSTIEKLWK